MQKEREESRVRETELTENLAAAEVKTSRLARWAPPLSSFLLPLLPIQ